MLPNVRYGILASTIAVLAAAGALPAAAQTASPGPAFESAEVTLRLVAEEPDADGMIRAALLVDLAPGWKTYWIDPGEAGVPPRIDLTKSQNLSADARIAFPAPHRFGDDYGTSNGYSEPMVVALTLMESLPGETTEIRASVMLGVCQTICIPVSADLALASSAASRDDAARVAAAFSALPATNDPRTGIAEASLSADGKILAVTARNPAGVGTDAADLFVAGPRGWYFGVPKVSESGGDLVFAVPVLEKPRSPSSDPLFVDAVLVAGGTQMEASALAVSEPSG